MYYIEFFRRNPGVLLARFHEVVRRSVRQWEADHPEDKCVLLLARTFRLGPQPGYLAVWQMDTFARMDAWKAAMQGRVPAEEDFNAVATIEYAGVYDELGAEIL